MSLKDRVVGSTLWSSFGNWSSQCFLLLVFVYLARELSPEDFGLYAVVGIVIGLGQMLSNPGFSQAVVSIERLDAVTRSTVFWTGLGLSTLLSFVALLSVVGLPNTLVSPDLSTLLLASIPMIILGTLANVPQALLMRKLLYKKIALVTLMANVLSGCSALLVAIQGYGVWALVMQQYVLLSVTAIGMFLLCDWRPTWQWSSPRLSAILSQGGHYFGISALAYANRRLDNALVGILFGVNLLGVYVIAKRIFLTLSDLLMKPFTQVALSAFSGVDRDIAKQRHAFMRMTVMTSLITAPVFAGFIVVAPDIMSLVFGTKWDDAIPVLQLLCIAGILRGFSLLVVPFLTVIQRGKTAFFLHLANTLGNFLAYLLFIPLGLMGIGLGFSVRAIVFFFITLALLQVVAHLPALSVLRQLWPIYLSVVLMVMAESLVAAMVSAPLSLLELMAVVMAAAAAYFLCVSLLARRHVKEIGSMARSYVS
ncbi:MAG: lipopolysaccharide biosynthesis protein [Pseudomonadota bacterium]